MPFCGLIVVLHADVSGDGICRVNAGVKRFVLASMVGKRLTSPVVQLALGASHAAAVTLQGELVCWGSNMHGQLGKLSGILDHAFAMRCRTLQDARHRDDTALRCQAEARVQGSSKWRRRWQRSQDAERESGSKACSWNSSLPPRWRVVR